MACGAPSEQKKADAEVQAICDEVKIQAQEKAGETFHKFDAVAYKTQVVAGVNYFIKVLVGDAKYLFLRVYKPLPHTGGKLELAAIKTGMKEADDLTYF